ncbi:MAG: FecR domain-containing protein [Kiloniellales bacterium]
MTTGLGDGEQAAEQARAWLVCLASGAMTAGELSRFEAWLQQSPCHERAFDRERAFWHRLAALEPTFERLARSSAEPGSAQDEARARRPMGLCRRASLVAPLSILGALAACLLLLVIAPEISTALRADYASGSDGIRQVALPDGSQATLNRNSAIRLRFGPAQRRVELLEGEAYFEVAPDPRRPFQVQALGGVSEALGTAYAVRRDAEGASVAVTEGQVAVSTEGQPDQGIALKAGEGVRYASDGRLGERFAVNGERGLAWRQGRVVFVDRPLAEALQELERYHPGRILLLGEGGAYRPISGVVDLDRLADGIAALAATHGLTAYQVTPFLTVLR